MITGVAFCPQAPALVPDVGRGLDAELGTVRQACRTAIRRAVRDCDRIVVLGSGPVTLDHAATARGSFAAFGVPLEVPLGSEAPGWVDLPPSLAVGAWLLRDALGPDSGATGRTAGPDMGDPPSFPRHSRTALVVVGDGSARRSEKAPGYFDDRAESFDRGIADALRDGDGTSLHFFGALDEVVAELDVAGVQAWRTAGSWLEAYDWDGDLLYDDAPFGVGYFVATWLRPSGA